MPGSHVKENLLIPVTGRLPADWHHLLMLAGLPQSTGPTGHMCTHVSHEEALEGVE